MSRTKPLFLENATLNSNYYQQPSPYIIAPSCHVNLLELSRYARQFGKRLIEVTPEEVQKFSI